jgi:hypothetical protein
VNPTFRETDKFLETQKKKTRDSGFTENHTNFDGKGWLPDPILHGKPNKPISFNFTYNR